jgi:hypothetical protein
MAWIDFAKILGAVTNDIGALLFYTVEPVDFG